MIGFIVTNNRITNRTADFFNSPIAFWLCFYLNTAFHMAVISPTCMFSDKSYYSFFGMRCRDKLDLCDTRYSIFYVDFVSSEKSRNV